MMFCCACKATVIWDIFICFHMNFCDTCLPIFTDIDFAHFYLLIVLFEYDVVS